MRLAGLPGEHLRLSTHGLSIDNAAVTISNAAGRIPYQPVTAPSRWASNNDLTVPSRRYFMLGDNVTNSLDSRYWGCLPSENVIGRIWFCYWPPQRIGIVK